MTVEQGDRRMFMLSLKGTYMGDHQYFTDLIEAIEDDTVVSEFLTWLYNAYNDREWYPQQLPMTRLKQDMMLESAPMIVQFIVNCKADFEMMFETTGTEVDTMLLDERFRRYTETYGDSRTKVHTRTLLADLQKYFNVKIINRHKAKLVDFKSLDYMEAHIKNYFGASFKWE